MWRTPEGDMYVVDCSSPGNFDRCVVKRFAANRASADTFTTVGRVTGQGGASGTAWTQTAVWASSASSSSPNIVYVAEQSLSVPTTGEVYYYSNFGDPSTRTQLGTSSLGAKWPSSTNVYPTAVAGNDNNVFVAVATDLYITAPCGGVNQPSCATAPLINTADAILMFNSNNPNGLLLPGPYAGRSEAANPYDNKWFRLNDIFASLDGSFLAVVDCGPGLCTGGGMLYSINLLDLTATPTAQLVANQYSFPTIFITPGGTLFATSTGYNAVPKAPTYNLPNGANLFGGGALKDVRKIGSNPLWTSNINGIVASSSCV
jgi:hypothetical protein